MAAPTDVKRGSASDPASRPSNVRARRTAASTTSSGVPPPNELSANTGSSTSSGDTRAATSRPAPSASPRAPSPATETLRASSSPTRGLLNGGARANPLAQLPHPPLERRGLLAECDCVGFVALLVPQRRRLSRARDAPGLVVGMSQATDHLGQGGHHLDLDEAPSPLLAVVVDRRDLERLANVHVERVVPVLLCLLVNTGVALEPALLRTRDEVLGDRADAVHVTDDEAGADNVPGSLEPVVRRPPPLGRWVRPVLVPVNVLAPGSAQERLPGLVHELGQRGRPLEKQRFVLLRIVVRPVVEARRHLSPVRRPLERLAEIALLVEITALAQLSRIALPGSLEPLQILVSESRALDPGRRLSAVCSRIRLA